MQSPTSNQQEHSDHFCMDVAVVEPPSFSLVSQQYRLCRLHYGAVAQDRYSEIRVPDFELYNKVEGVASLD